MHRQADDDDVAGDDTAVSAGLPTCLDMFATEPALYREYGRHQRIH